MQTINRYPKYIVAIFIAATLTLGSCKKFLEPELKTQVNLKEVFANDNNAKSALVGMYSSIGNQNTPFNGTITQTSAFASDELVYAFGDASIDQIVSNQIQANNETFLKIWNEIYNTIYQANSIVEGSSASAGMSTSYKNVISGEAKFIRALSHFYLVNLFGDVPLITVTSKDITAFKPRTSKQEVYQQIIADLKDAYNALPSDFSLSDGKRNMANKWAAAALLSRVYLYTGNYAEAEAKASEVISNTALFELQTNLSDVYLKDNRESILQFERFADNTNEGFLFTFYLQVLGFGDHIIQNGLISSFEDGDKRKDNWTLTTASGSIPYKYKFPATNIENNVVLRLAELYLIRAEARAQLAKSGGGSFASAQSDINVLRTRAGLSNLTNMVDFESANAAIENERRHELFCEWGHRWLDLNRLPSLSTSGKTRADDVLGELKPTWTSSASLFPIPTKSIATNPFLKQNPGYN